LTAAAFSGYAWGSGISFDLTSSSVAIVAGGTITFTGTVTNNSGADLDASDFFFNFFGYDPSSVTPFQDLGVVTDFLIPSGATSFRVPLFDITLVSVSAGPSFPVEVELEDVNNDLSEVQTVTVSTASTIVPEPRAPWLLAVGLLGIVLVKLVGRKVSVMGSVALLLWGAPVARAQSALSTQAPISGLNGDTFAIFLPLANSGTATVSNVQVTGAVMNGGSPVNLSLPYTLPEALRSNDTEVLDLQFVSGNLLAGNRYLVTVRGTYQSGEQVFGFSVNRFVTVTVPSASLLTEIQQWVDIDALIAKVNTLPGVDVAADNQALLAAIQANPDFVRSGIDAPSSSVWAMFADGSPLVFGNDRRTPSSSAGSSATAAQNQISSGFINRSSLAAGDAAVVPPTEIPASSQVRLLWADYYSLTGSAIVAYLAPWLTAANYKPIQNIDVSSFRDDNATVESLKKVGGDGVLYYAAHGGFFGDGKTLYTPLTFALSTSTDANAINDTPYECDLHPDHCVADQGPFRLVRCGFHLNGDGPEVPRYCLTAAFVTKYWTDFSDNSFVYIAACNSDDPRPSTALPSGVPQGAQDFKQAVFSKNVSVYAGWTNEMPYQVADATDLLLFDRLLGANQWDHFSLPYSGFGSGDFLKETLPDINGNTFYQRPFDWQSVIQSDVQNHSIKFLALDGKTPLSSPLGVYQPENAVLQFTPNANLSSVFGLLSPSIGWAQIWESGLTNRVLGQPQLQIFGLFGSAAATLTVGGQQISDFSPITAYEVLADFPSSAASGSDITVSVQGHPSNTVRLTEWLGQFNVKNQWTGDAQSGSGGSLTETVTLNPDFRADVREWRPQIHLPPVANMQVIQNKVNGTTANYACAGSASHTDPGPPPFTTTNTWSGVGNLASWNDTVPASPPAQYFFFAGTIGMPQNAPMQLQFEFSGGPQGCAAAISNSSGPFYFDISQARLANGVVMTFDPQTAMIAPDKISYTDCLLGPLLPGGSSSCSFMWNAISPVTVTLPDPKSAR
jgi:hypothetical protein